VVAPQQSAEHSCGVARFNPRIIDKEAETMQNRENSDLGSNDNNSSDSIAGTAPGIPDDALAPGEELPVPPTDDEVERAARALGSPTAGRDTLPLEGE
jgi:hypothetical protein